MSPVRMTRATPAAGRGWSLVELTILLVVLAMLCAVLTPVIGRFVTNAKVLRCREDVEALASAIGMFLEDTALRYFYQDGSNCWGGHARLILSPPPGCNRDAVEMLAGDGDVPEVGPDGSALWTRAVNFEDVDFFECHLVTNRPGNDPGRAYRTPTETTAGAFARAESAGFNSEFAWRGPYITAPIAPDPWGNRYAANVKYLDPRSRSANETPGANGYAQDVAVISAGPDEEVDSSFIVDGVTPSDDDVICVVSSNSRP